MTTQVAINGQSVGTGSNVGDNKFSISPLTIGGTTTAYVVNIKLVNGAAGYDRNQVIRVWHTTTTQTVSATDAPKHLNQTARYVDIRPGQDSAAVQIVDSDLEPVTGANFHCWCTVPKYSVAATLTVTLVELP